MKMETSTMCLPDLGDIKEWNVDAYGDAGYESYQIKYQVVEDVLYLLQIERQIRHV